MDEFYVATGYQGHQVGDFLVRLEERLAIRITPLVNEDWEKENGLSVLKAQGCSPTFPSDPSLIFAAPAWSPW